MRKKNNYNRKRENPLHYVHSDNDSLVLGSFQLR